MILCGLSVGLAGNMLIWNIGAEGQLVMGGIAGAGVALFGSAYIPAFLVIPVMLVAGILGGACWGLIPGFLKARLQINEIITSLMLNYVAILWLEHLYFGPWRDPAGRGFPGTAMLPDGAWFPRFWGTRIHLGLMLGLGAAVLIWFLLSYTRWGFQPESCQVRPHKHHPQHLMGDGNQRGTGRSGGNLRDRRHSLSPAAGVGDRHRLRGNYRCLAG
jgi:simple sugar transport system permease protein